MVGIDSFTRGKVVGLATFHRKSISRVSLHSVLVHSHPAIITHLCPEPLVSYISFVSRCYSAPSFGMETASAGHELLSFINASPTRESAPSSHPWESFDAL